MPARTVTLAALTAAALLAGCGAAAGSSPRDEPEAPAPAAGPVNFIQETRASAVGKEALSTGVLTLDARGCFRVGADGPVLVWPAEAALDLGEPGTVRVHDVRSGASVRVGDRVALGGGSFPTDYAGAFNRPAAPCEGALWDVDSFETAAAFEARHPHLRQGG